MVYKSKLGEMIWAKVLSLLILCINTTALAAGGLRKTKTNEVRIEKLHVTDDVILFQRSSYTRRETQIAPVAFVAATNTIEIDGKTYSLDNLEEFSVLSPDIVISSDDPELTSENVPTATHWMGKDGKAEIFVAKDENDRISLIDIFDGENITTLVANFTTGEYEEIPFDFDGLNSTLEIDADQENPDDVHIPAFDPSFNDNIFVAQSACGQYRQINVAIAVTSSFCSWSGGQQAAVKRVQTIMAHAMNKYRQQGLCLTLKLSALDMRCSPGQDIYNNMATMKSGCFSTGMLQDFQNYWEKNMKHVNRDTAHLLTARAFDGPVGCSTQGTMCRQGSYGVDYMTMYPSLDMQGNLLAHEIAHNLGASHVNGEGYIMSTYVTDGRNGFSPQAKYQMSQYVNKYGNCLKYTF